MSLDQNEEKSGGFSWWWLLPWLAAGLAALFYLLWTRRRDGVTIQPVNIDLSFIRGVGPVPEAGKELELPVAEPAKPDDLTAISGIGPKIATLLQEQGLKTFAQLAATTPDHLREVLLAANVRLADPTTWPDQARLAAAGKLEELKDFIARQRANRGG